MAGEAILKKIETSAKMKKVKGLLVFINFLFWGAINSFPQDLHNGISGIEKSSLSVNGNLVEIYTLTTGRIQIHKCHYQNCKKEKSPYISRFLKILRDTTYAAPLTINAYLIKHPEGIFVIDAGGDPYWYDKSTWECEQFSRRIAQKLARVDVKPEESLESRLSQIGIEKSEVKAAIITHLHFDHTAGLKKLSAPTYVGKGDIKNGRIIGSVPCKFLDGVNLIQVEPLLKNSYANPADIGDKLFGAGLSLTKDGAIKVYSTPGHTPGSLTIRVKTDQGDLWFIGDIAFDHTEIEPSSQVAGIHFSIKKIRSLHKKFKEIQITSKAFLIPAHEEKLNQRLTVWLNQKK